MANKKRKSLVYIIKTKKTMTTSRRNAPHFERSNYDTAKIIYKRTFGYIATDNNEREIRFCGEIFRSKHVTHLQTKQMPPLQKF